MIAFPETFAKSVALIETGTLVLVRGKLERDDETSRILATEILPLDSVRERVARVRDVVPDLAIRTTCIVGFPGETDADFEMLLDWLDSLQPVTGESGT